MDGETQKGEWLNVAWIESHQDLIRHPKTKKFMRKLNVTTPVAVGHLHMFWWWAMDFAEDGDISRFDEYDISDACEWSGDAKKFFEALCYSGFIDESDHGFIIHDWYDYAGKLIELRKKDAERKRNSRGKNKKNDEVPEDVRRTSDGHPEESEGNPTESIRDLNPNPNLTTIGESQITIMNLYCSLHGKMDLHLKPIEREMMMELACSEIPLKFVLETMQKLFEVKEKKGEKIRGFGYYPPIIQDAWTNVNSTSISPKQGNIPVPKKESPRLPDLED